MRTEAQKATIEKALAARKARCDERAERIRILLDRGNAPEEVAVIEGCHVKTVRRIMRDCGLGSPPKTSKYHPKVKTWDIESHELAGGGLLPEPRPVYSGPVRWRQRRNQQVREVQS